MKFLRLSPLPEIKFQHRTYTNQYFIETNEFELNGYYYIADEYSDTYTLFLKKRTLEDMVYRDLYLKKQPAPKSLEFAWYYHKKLEDIWEKI